MQFIGFLMFLVVFSVAFFVIASLSIILPMSIKSSCKKKVEEQGSCCNKK